MSRAAPIPRFLLPQRGLIWRSRISTPSRSFAIRNVSSTKPLNKKSPKQSGKPLVLEKPTKFNPPSHGSRLRASAPRYPGPQLSAEEEAAQAAKKYPNMMPPPGTFMHWFVNNTSIHIWITMSTLSVLAATVWTTNFKQNSPFADMLPHWTQFFLHPITAPRTLFEVIRLDSERTTAETMEKRKRKVEDVQKRAAYRKAHGLEDDVGFGGWTAKSDAESIGPAIPVGDIEGSQDAIGGAQEVKAQRKPVRKWLGIW